MVNIFDGLSHPSNPAHTLIQTQRKIYTEWQEKITAIAPDDDLEESAWGINPITIYELFGVRGEDLAALPPVSPLVRHIRSHLVEAYQKRGLHFPPDDVYAIADPDETDRSNQRTAFHGVALHLGLGYDFKVPLLLNKNLDGQSFAFFFALRLIKVPRMHLYSFLEYHLRTSFQNDKDAYTTFLKLLRLYLSDELADLEHLGKRYPFSEDLKSSIAEWAASIKEGVAQVDEVEIYESEVLPSDSKKPIVYDINQTDFRRALSVFKLVKNKHNRSVISDEDLAYLKAQGPYIILDESQRKIRLELYKGDKEKVYRFFHWIWDNIGGSHNDGKEGFAEYIFCYFSDFKASISSLSMSLRATSLDEQKRYNEAYRKYNNQ